MPAPILSISINVYPAPAWWEAAWWGRGRGGGGLNTITGSIVAVPGAALPPVPLCQLRLARPLHRPHRGTAGHGKVYNNKMPNWGAREREREPGDTGHCHVTAPSRS